MLSSIDNVSNSQKYSSRLLSHQTEVRRVFMRSVCDISNIFILTITEPKGEKSGRKWMLCGHA